MTEIKITEISCFSCGVSFWITENHDKDLIKTKQTFYCPGGHAQTYVGKSDKAKLEDALEEIKNCNNKHNESEEKIKGLKNSISVYKGHISRLKRK